MATKENDKMTTSVSKYKKIVSDIFSEQKQTEITDAFNEEIERITKLRAEAADRKEKVQALGNKHKVVKEDYEKFSKELIAIDSSVEKLPVNIETKDFLDKSAEFIKNGELDETELMFTVFETYDIIRNINNIEHKNKKIYQDFIEEKFTTPVVSVIIELVSDTDGSARHSQQSYIQRWDEIQNEELKLINGLTNNEKKDLINKYIIIKKKFIKKYLESTDNDSSFDDVKKNITKVEEYEEFVNLLVDISKIAIVTHVLQNIKLNEEDNSYKELLEKIEGIKVDSDSENIRKQIKGSLQTKEKKNFNEELEKLYEALFNHEEYDNLKGEIEKNYGQYTKDEKLWEIFGEVKNEFDRQYNIAIKNDFKFDILNNDWKDNGLKFDQEEINGIILSLKHNMTNLEGKKNEEENDFIKKAIKEAIDTKKHIYEKKQKKCKRMYYKHLSEKFKKLFLNPEEAKSINFLEENVLINDLKKK